MISVGQTIRDTWSSGNQIWKQVTMSEIATGQGQFLARQRQHSERLAALEEKEAWYGEGAPPGPDGVFDLEEELAIAIGSEAKGDKDGAVQESHTCPTFEISSDPEESPTPPRSREPPQRDLVSRGEEMKSARFQTASALAGGVLMDQWSIPDRQQVLTKAIDIELAHFHLPTGMRQMLPPLSRRTGVSTQRAPPRRPLSPVRSEHLRPGLLRPEPFRTETVQAESVRAETVRPELVRRTEGNFSPAEMPPPDPSYSEMPLRGGESVD